jgi:hypothetical protein
MNRLPSDIQIVLCPEGGFAASAYSIGAFSEGQTPNEAYENLLNVIRELRGVHETQRLPHRERVPASARRSLGRSESDGCAYPNMPHVPNAKTRAAMREGQRGGLPRFNDIASLMADLNEED